MGDSHLLLKNYEIGGDEGAQQVAFVNAKCDLTDEIEFFILLF